MGVLLLLALQAEGTYTLCREVEGYSGETVELKDGRFRYWFTSDVVVEDEPAYPLSGAYRIEGDQLTLDHARIYRPRRAIAKIQGVDVLLRADAAELLKKENRLHPYGVLLKGDPKNRPSIETITSPEMKARDKKDFEERFADVPQEARELLRGRTAERDPGMAAYKAAIARARASLEAKLVSQLIALRGRESSCDIDAGSVLEDLFEATWLLKEPPPFLKDPPSRKKALETLIEGLSAAKDRNALEHTLVLFLRVSGVETMDLAVPETNLRVKLKSLPNGGGTYGSEGTAVDDVRWLKTISKVIPACQAWMRSQLAR